MKHIYLILFLILPTVSIYGQKTIEGPVTFAGGVTMTAGDTLTVGRGTMPNGGFKYIYSKPSMLSTAMTPLHSSSGGMTLVVKRIDLYGNNRLGRKHFAIVNPGGLSNYMVDVADAIATGEVVKINGAKIGALSAGTLSVADELLKLKSLLDAGAITQAEYDSQKKKLLGN
jgi:hypothetical protein